MPCLFSRWLLTSGKRSSYWPIAQGTILLAGKETKIENIYNEDSEKFENINLYCANIQYTYQVANTSYTGDKLNIYSNCNRNRFFEKDIFKTVAKYSKGDITDIYYDPDEPSKSVLQIETNLKSYLMLLIGIGMLVYLIFHDKFKRK